MAQLEAKCKFMHIPGKGYNSTFHMATSTTLSNSDVCYICDWVLFSPSVLQCQ
jgi:hypothetical protein